MTAKSGRNDSCPCGSGKKYKKCCALKVQRHYGNTVLLVIVGLLMAAGLVAGINSFMQGPGHSGKPAGVWSPEHGHYH